MADSPHRFTTTPRKLSRGDTSSWGGDNDWQNSITENSSVTVKDGSIVPVEIPGPTVGLAAYYPLDESTGDARDLINGNDATVHGAEQGVTVNGRTGYRFNGVDNYLDPPNFGLDNDQSFTWALWMRHNSDGFDTFVGKYDTNTKYHYFRVQQESDKIIVTAGDTAGTYERAESTIEVPPNTWTHVATVYDNPNNELRLYINGELEVKVTATPSSFAIGEGVDIGRRAGDLVEYFSGEMAGIRLYELPVTTPGIQSVYDSTK
jgi:hypothetical protein